MLGFGLVKRVWQRSWRQRATLYCFVISRCERRRPRYIRDLHVDDVTQVAYWSHATLGSRESRHDRNPLVDGDVDTIAPAIARDSTGHPVPSVHPIACPGRVRVQIRDLDRLLDDGGGMEFTSRGPRRGPARIIAQLLVHVGRRDALRAAGARQRHPGCECRKNGLDHVRVRWRGHDQYSSVVWRAAQPQTRTDLRRIDQAVISVASSSYYVTHRHNMS